jgi:hypothetical protein
VSDESQRCVDTNSGTVIDPDIQADGIDVGEGLEHRAHDGASQPAPTAVATRIDVANGGDAFAARQEMRARGRHKSLVCVTAEDRADVVQVGPAGHREGGAASGPYRQ